MLKTKMIIILACMTLTAGCSSSSTTASVDWDNMNFAAVHCDGNSDSEACTGTANDVSAIMRRGKK